MAYNINVWSYYIGRLPKSSERSLFALAGIIGLLLRATTFNIDVYALSSLGLLVVGAVILRGSVTLSP